MPVSPSSAALKLAFSRRSDEGREGQHLAAPGDRLALEVGERDDGVDQAHLERLLGVVEAAEEPDLLRLLGPDDARSRPAPKPPSKLPTRGPVWPKTRVVGGDRQVADEVEDVAAADRVAGDHRDHRLRQAADLDLQVADVEAADALLGDLVVADVAVVAADPLVAAGAEGLVARAGEDDRADLGVVAGRLEGVAELDQRLRPEGVADLGPVDRDLRDPVGRARRGCPRSRPRLATRSARRAPPRAGRPCGVSASCGDDSHATT